MRARISTGSRSPTCSKAIAWCSNARRIPCASYIPPATVTSPRCARSSAGAKYPSNQDRFAGQMLRALEVRDFVLIDRASLELSEGFTVLTGETGAGKSILVDAIELLVGGRGDGAMVREGAERAELSGEFDVSKAVGAWLEERDLGGDPGQVVLRRSIDRAGRSRCFINGHAATLAQLRDAGEWLVDLHGQHAHQSLLRSAAQRALLDSHAAAEEVARDTAQA